MRRRVLLILLTVFPAALSMGGCHEPTLEDKILSTLDVVKQIVEIWV